MSEHQILHRGDRIRYMCVRCGRCCATGPNVALTIYDICRIARYLGMDWRELRGRYIIAIIADMIPVPVLRGINDNCVFMEIEDGLPKCRIYPVRPMRCRLYPFLPVSPGKTDVIAVDEKCIGIGEGELVEPPWNDLEQYYKELRSHYKRIYELVFDEGYEPLEALEKALDELCSKSSNNSL